MNNILTQTLLSFSYTCDIKTLEGFVKGGRDKVPKEASEYQTKLIFGWSEQEIKEHIEAVATKAKDGLEISAREFQSPYYESGMGNFDCKYFNYEFSVSQSEEDFSQCVFKGVLEIKDAEIDDEIHVAIDECFEHTFETAESSFPKNGINLKELIYSIDDNKKQLNEVFEFSYENDFSLFQLVNKEKGTVIKVNDRGVNVDFKKPEPISQMLISLNEVNKNIFLTADQTLLLSN